MHTDSLEQRFPFRFRHRLSQPGKSCVRNRRRYYRCASLHQDMIGQNHRTVHKIY